MDLAAGVADLHLHTTASDGTCSLDDRIAQARERDLLTIAITDHDCIADELEGRAHIRGGVEVVTGVEIRARIRDTKVEFLGHFVDPETDVLSSLLSRVRQYRRERNEEMIERLVESTGLDLSYDDLDSRSEGLLGRPHMAAALVDAGVVDSIGEAFDDHLAEDGDAYVRMEMVDASEAIDAIHAAGGVASLAHPGRVRTDEIDAIVSDLVDVGLDGIEVWYPYREDRSDAYADLGVSDAVALAAEHGLLRTGGSDCHGPESGKFRIGSVRTPDPDFEALRRVAGERAPLATE